MIKKCLILFIMIWFQANAQKTVIDSIFGVQDYLLEIRNSVNSNESPRKKLDKLNSLIQSATTQKAIFSRNITKISGQPQEEVQLKSLLNFILQSLVLYETDLKNNNIKSAQNELKYMNKNISNLVYKIDFHCKVAKTKIDENTHK